jgi:hypothetical protein
MLIHAISLGVGIGGLLGLARIVFKQQIIFFLLPLYILAVILTYFSTEAILHIAWDAAAVTTGPVTVPLILGVGIATATEVKASEGFGILALASLCPILTTLTLGLIIQIPWIESYVYSGQVEDEAAEHEMDHMLGEGLELPNYGTMEEKQEPLVELEDKDKEDALTTSGVYVL